MKLNKPGRVLFAKSSQLDPVEVGFPNERSKRLREGMPAANLIVAVGAQKHDP